MDSGIGAENKPDFGLMQPALGVRLPLSWLEMKRARGRPPKIPSPPPGAGKDLSENLLALFDGLWRRPEEPDTDMLRNFAKKHGVGYGTLQRAREGKTATRLDTLEKIAQGFKVDVAQLLIPGEGTRIVASRKKRGPSRIDSSRELQSVSGAGDPMRPPSVDAVDPPIK
jgi:transcriptional regulator with XRE-family HTH domain